jgi:bis(5'-nucleosidyl)-tetraphosphatase
MTGRWPHPHGSKQEGTGRSLTKGDDASFGVVPLRYRNRQWHVLLVQHKQGHWAFPKGHAEPGESHATTACRELYEETQCRVLRFLDFTPLTETYQFRAAHRVISKTVTYFIAEVDGEPRPQPEELKATAWFGLREADQRATFEKCRRMLQHVADLVGEKRPDQLPGRPDLAVAPWESTSSAQAGDARS